MTTYAATMITVLVLLASAHAQAALPGPLTEKDVNLRLAAPMAKLRLRVDDWSPGVEHIEMLCVIREQTLDRCRVDRAQNAEREALEWVFDFAAKAKVADLDRHGRPTSGRTIILKWDLRAK